MQKGNALFFGLHSQDGARVSAYWSLDTFFSAQRRMIFSSFFSSSLVLIFFLTQKKGFLEILLA